MCFFADFHSLCVDVVDESAFCDFDFPAIFEYSDFVDVVGESLDESVFADFEFPAIIECSDLRFVISFES